MTRFSALYFPDTLPPPTVVAELAPLLGPIRSHRCWPDDQPPSPWAELATAGQLEFLTSFDPGPDSQRLQALLRELADRRGEDALLFAQGLAAEFSAQRQETAPELVAPLLGLTEDAAAGREREALWQALLLLKLAENLERGELEVEEGLRRIEAGRQALLHRLNGPDDDDNEDDGAKADSRAAEQPSSRPRPWRNSARLLRAWSRLFLLAPERPELLVSADLEAVALLRENAENQGHPPQPLVTLQIPRLTLGAGGEAAGHALRQALAQAAVNGTPGETAAAAAAWNRLATEGREQGAPDSGTLGTLEILLFPRTPLSQLITASGNRLPDQNRLKPPAATDTKTGHGEKPHGLLGAYQPL